MNNSVYIAEYSLQSGLKKLGQTLANRATKDRAKVKRAAEAVGRRISRGTKGARSGISNAVKNTTQNVQSKVTNVVREAAKTGGEYAANNVATPAQKAFTRKALMNGLTDPVVAGAAGALGLGALGGGYAVYRGGRAVVKKLGQKPETKAQKRRKYINEKVDNALNRFSTPDRNTVEFANARNFFQRKKEEKNKAGKYALIGGTGLVGLGGAGAAIRYGGAELGYRKAKQGMRNTVGNTVKKAVDQRGRLSIDDLKGAGAVFLGEAKKASKGGAKKLFKKDLKLVSKLFRK